MEQDSMVGSIELCLLKFVAMTDGKYSYFLLKLVKHVVKFNLTKYLCEQPLE